MERLSLSNAASAAGWRAKQGLMDSLPRIVEADYHAMVMGTRDYLAKCGFRRVLLGLSGGIDSAIVATIAADATAAMVERLTGKAASAAELAAAKGAA